MLKKKSTADGKKKRKVDLSAIARRMGNEIDEIWEKYSKEYGRLDELGELQFGWYSSLVWREEQLRLSGMVIGIPKYAFEKLEETTRIEASKSLIHQVSMEKGWTEEQLKIVRQVLSERQSPRNPPGVA